MVQCPFCEKTVQKYKSNSHIIPKAFIKPAKRSGTLAYIGVVDGLLEKLQDGVKEDFICDECENSFSNDDSYGAVILMNTSPSSPLRNGVSEKKIPQLRLSFYEITGFNFTKLKKFVLSIILRDHCMKIVLGSSRLMNDQNFSDMRADYNLPTASNERFKVVIHKVENMLSQLAFTVSMPTMSNDRDAITFTCGGFAFMVYINAPQDAAMLSFVDSCGLVPPGRLFMPVADFTMIGTFKNAKSSITNKMQEWELKYPGKQKK